MNVPTTSTGKVSESPETKQEKTENSISAKVKEASADVNTEPTEAQRRACYHYRGWSLSVVEIRTQEKNKYTALQLGFDDKKPSRVNKPMKGYFSKQGVTPKRWLREFQWDDVTPLFCRPG